MMSAGLSSQGSGPMEMQASTAPLDPKSCTELVCAMLTALHPNWLLSLASPAFSPRGLEGWGKKDGRSMPSFSYIWNGEVLLNLKIDEWKWGGVGQEEIMSHISLIVNKMSSMLACTVTLHIPKTEKMMTPQL